MNETNPETVSLTSSGKILSAYAGQQAESGSGLSRMVAERAGRNAEKSAHLKKMLTQAEEDYKKEKGVLNQRLNARLKATEQARDDHIRQAELDALRTIEVERALALKQRQQWEHGTETKKTGFLSKLKPRSRISVVVGIILYVVLLVLLFSFKNNENAAFPLADGQSLQSSSVDGGDTLLLALVIFPIYSLAIAFLVEMLVKFEKWFYGIDRRKKTIARKKQASTGKSFEERMAYLNNQETRVRNRILESPGEYNLPCVTEYLEKVHEYTAAAEAEKAQIHHEMDEEFSAVREKWEQKQQTLRNNWISETTQAAVSCAEYFEYKYGNPGIDRGPAFWLVFRFCGRDGVIARAPRGISQLRTTMKIRVEVSEKRLYVTIRDINGRQLLEDKESQIYQFNRVNQADLTEPAERYGYACGLMYCTLQEAQKVLEQARYDRTFDLKGTDLDLDGFTILYDGSI